jgi:hypothetical protein
MDRLYSGNLKRLQEMLQLRAETSRLIDLRLVQCAQSVRPSIEQLHNMLQNDLLVLQRAPIESLRRTPIAIPDANFPAYFAGTVALPATCDITSSYLPRQLLDIHRIAYPPPELQPMLEQLQFPTYQAAECLLPLIQTLKSARMLLHADALLEQRGGVDDGRGMFNITDVLCTPGADEESRIASSRMQIKKLRAEAMQFANSDGAIQGIRSSTSGTQRYRERAHH